MRAEHWSNKRADPIIMGTFLQLAQINPAPIYGVFCLGEGEGGEQP